MNKALIRKTIREIGNPEEYPSNEYITRLYNILLRRDPDVDGLGRYANLQDLRTAIDEILRSDEFKLCSSVNSYFPLRSASCRVLLFGAFGNGNLGDRIQAQSLAHVIDQICPCLEVWACTDMPCSFPFSHDRVLPTNAAQDPNIINQFDLLLIGGGGLFSHPHNPLCDSQWQEALNLPIGIVGVGADVNVVARSQHLIEKATYVSGRDESSIRALGNVCADVRFIPDPILGDAINVNAKSLLSRMRFSKLWILKSSVHCEIDALSALIDPTNDAVCVLEPSYDAWLLSRFPNAFAIYTRTELLRLIACSNLVISTRYHGCILAILAGKPVVGVYEDKSRLLLERYGNATFFEWNFSDWKDPMTREYKDVTQHVIQDQRVFRNELTHALNKLLPDAVGAKLSELPMHTEESKR